MKFTKTAFFLFIVLLFIFITIPAHSQFLSKQWRINQSQKKETKIKEGKWLVLPLAGPYYTPEMKLAFAGGIMISFKTKRTDTLIQRSVLPVLGGVSTTGAYFFGTRLISFWFKDKIRIYGDFNFKHLPDNYWGVGYDAGRYTEKSDSTTAYIRTWWQINPVFLWQFKRNYFVGTNIDLNFTKGSKPSQGVAENSYYIEYNNKPFNSGLGLTLLYDSRDVPANSWNGTYINLSSTFYGSYFGSDNDYQIYLIDFRNYWTIIRPGSTLAAQLKCRLGYGDVPYGEMSQPGTPFDLRGYYWGRFRAPSMLLGIVEYRYMFLMRNEKLSPHGIVLWTGIGTMGNTVKSFEDLLPNAGLGYRLQLQPRMNLRLDFGIGTDSYGFYFNFIEAF